MTSEAPSRVETAGSAPSCKQPPFPPPQGVPECDATTTLPGNMLAPFQYLHIPSRPSTTKRQSAHLPTKVPIPVYSLKKLPLPSGDEASHHEPTMRLEPPLRSLGSANTARCSRDSSAPTARALFHHTASLKERGGDDVCWTDESPRVSSATSRRPPPMAHAIETYLSRELQVLANAANGASAGSSAEAPRALDPLEFLQPHREALRMLCQGLPSYAPLLTSIMHAYDSTLKSQATITSVAKAISDNAVQVKQTHDAKVASLFATINELEEHCKASAAALQATAALEAKQVTGNPAQANLEKENRLLKEQIAALEYEKSGDLEKLITLIAAIKECDARVKTLEDALQDAKLQLEEMHSLKKMMAESQSELGQLKSTYKDAVPLTRFNNAIRELESQLSASQQETKRVRRLCIARGSAIDILERKIKSLTEEVDRFRMAVGSRSVREALTPRPNWLAAQHTLPELRDFAAEVPVPMLDDEGKPRMIAGAKESSLQVEFLVEKVVELQATCDTLRTAAVSASPIANASPADASPSQTGGSQPSLKSRQSMSSVVAAVASPSLRQSSPLRGSMLFCFGGSTLVPPHLREVGMVPRVAFESSRLREMMHDFFSGSVRKQAEAALLYSVNELAKHFLSFASQQFAFSSELRTKCNGCPQYLAYNLLHGLVPAPIPQLQLFQCVMNGTMPICIAFSALDREAEVQRELNALCEAHNKTRLRRATVLELIVPLLSYKQRDEIDELRNSLGVENTVDVSAVASQKSKFMETLFEQECLDGMRIYTLFLEKLTSASVVSPEGTRMVSTSSVLNAIADIEPRTQQRTIDALIVGDSGEDMLFPLEHTINALRTSMLVRVSTKQQQA